MSHSLRVKIKGLQYKGIITDKDCDRLCKALDNEDVLDKIRVEIIQMPTISFNANDVYKADVLAIIDKYRTEDRVWKMTREEINILQDIVDIYENEDMYPTLNDKQVRTIKKAIKALEPCSNCCNGNQIEKAKLCQKSYLTGMEHKWIPVSERLPKDAQKILYSTKTGQVYSGVYLDDESENSWYSILNDCNEYNDLVTAWMPFPEPYMAESEEI